VCINKQGMQRKVGSTAPEEFRLPIYDIYFVFMPNLSLLVTVIAIRYDCMRRFFP